jgi:alpha-beta hydrolase superfamily lysophospholipase
LITRDLLSLPLVDSGRVDINSGVARLSKTIWATHWFDPDQRPDTVFLIVHPASNFLGHYALERLARRGVGAVGLATRYVGNDSALIMENCVLDVAAAIRRLRELGYGTVVLVGNSGGGGLAALYQQQAEHPDIVATPAGDPLDLIKADLLPADLLVMAMAHPGRATVYTEGLDPAIRDELRPFDRDADLDMFAPGRTVPYDADFVDAYRDGQLERNRRITRWVQAELAALADGTHHACSGRPAPDDLPFLVHGTAADLRFLDTTIDPSDRLPTTLWGAPWEANFRPASLGHHTSLRSWLSQWSYDLSRANAPRCLPGVSVPVLVVSGSADSAAFPSHAASMYEAVAHDRKDRLEIKGAGHYFEDRPDLIDHMCDHLVEWAGR